MLDTKRKLRIDANEASLMPQPLQEENTHKNGALVVVFSHDQIGRGDQELGRELVLPYLESLAKLPLPPQAMLFYNTGVKLLTEGSGVEKILSRLESRGCEMLACNLSLKQLGLLGQMSVGEISTLEIMLDRQLGADKILWP